MHKIILNKSRSVAKALARAGWGADGNENGSVICRGSRQIAGEGEAAGRTAVRHEFVEAWFAAIFS